MNSKRALFMLMINQKKVRDGFKLVDLNTMEKVSIEECYEIVMEDLEKLEKYKIANKIFSSYLILFNGVSFDTFITTQCTDEEQEICREVFKEVLENE